MNIFKKIFFFVLENLLFRKCLCKGWISHDERSSFKASLCISLCSALYVREVNFFSNFTHSELRNQIKPEIMELIKQQRLNYLIGGSRFAKYSKNGRIRGILINNFFSLFIIILGATKRQKKLRNHGDALN